ncbi:hypothetical protein HDU98_006980 [Podochytrium sp. JEL0797]|nr:hypothetical protein HDU98_006980 [Podochytrium sp. JEL0797]
MDPMDPNDPRQFFPMEFSGPPRRGGFQTQQPGPRRGQQQPGAGNRGGRGGNSRRGRGGAHHEPQRNFHNNQPQRYFHNETNNSSTDNSSTNNFVAFNSWKSIEDPWAQLQQQLERGLFNIEQEVPFMSRPNNVRQCFQTKKIHAEPVKKRELKAPQGLTNETALNLYGGVTF